MRWITAHLTGSHETGEVDRLGNPITETVDLGTLDARPVPWSATPTENIGNPYDDTTMTLETSASLATVQAAETATFDSFPGTYQVLGVTDAGRWRLFGVQRMKGAL